jgi:hypothetical protein
VSARVWMHDSSGLMWIVLDDGDNGVFVLDESSQELVETDTVPAAARELT